MTVWSEGDRVRDEKSGKAGTVVQVTGPPPFIYRVMVAAHDGGPPIMIYRYGHQLREVRPAPGVSSPSSPAWGRRPGRGRPGRR
ncbi:hypothetical protein FM076_11695 [Streptomyces albus subsp. chlorinus]|nr:hypothetical protein [Streptomyces albus subsp. chlorinus]